MYTIYFISNVYSVVCVEPWGDVRFLEKGKRQYMTLSVAAFTESQYFE